MCRCTLCLWQGLLSVPLHLVKPWRATVSRSQKSQKPVLNVFLCSSALSNWEIRYVRFRYHCNYYYNYYRLFKLLYNSFPRNAIIPRNIFSREIYYFFTMKFLSLEIISFPRSNLYGKEPLMWAMGTLLGTFSWSTKHPEQVYGVKFVKFFSIAWILSSTTGQRWDHFSRKRRFDIVVSVKLRLVYFASLRYSMTWSCFTLMPRNKLLYSR